MNADAGCSTTPLAAEQLRQPGLAGSKSLRPYLLNPRPLDAVPYTLVSHLDRLPRQAVLLGQGLLQQRILEGSLQQQPQALSRAGCPMCMSSEAGYWGCQHKQHLCCGTGRPRCQCRTAGTKGAGLMTLQSRHEAVIIRGSQG